MHSDFVPMFSEASVPNVLVDGAVSILLGLVDPHEGIPIPFHTRGVQDLGIGEQPEQGPRLIR